MSRHLSAKRCTDYRFYKQVEDAYIYANKTLLRVMLEEQELIPHLRYTNLTCEVDL